MPIFPDKASDEGRRRRIIPMRWTLAAGTAIVALAVRARMRSIAAVAPDLRSPVLLLPGLINGVTRPLIQRAIKATPMKKPNDVRVETYHVSRGDADATTRLMIFDREGSSGIRPVLFWMHGGGYVTGTPEQDVSLIALLLARFDIVVASVDYRLAPEHPFPVPLNDCHAALAWVVEHADELKIDPARLLVGGQSAGGGLAAALVQRLIDQGPVKPIFQLLIYPMLDAMTVARKNDKGTGAFVWTPTSNRFGWQSYLGGEPTSGSYPAYAVPAARGDLKGLPPTWIGVGSLDLFFEEDRHYAARLREAGVSCDLYIADGAYHGFDILVPEAASTTLFNESMFSALDEALNQDAMRKSAT